MEKTFCQRYPSPVSQLLAKTLDLIWPLAKLIDEYSLECRFEICPYDKNDASATVVFNDAGELIKNLENIWSNSNKVIRDWWITNKSQDCVNILLYDHTFWIPRPQIFEIVHPHGLCCTARFFDKIKLDLELFALALSSQQSIPILRHQTTCHGKIKNVSLFYNFVTCFVLDHADDGSLQEQTITFYFAGRWKGFLRNLTGKHAVYIDPRDVVVYKIMNSV